MDQTAKSIENLKCELDDFKDEITRLYGGNEKSQWKNDPIFLAIKAVELKKSEELVEYLKSLAREHAQSLYDDVQAFDQQYEEDRKLQVELKEAGIPVYGEVNPEDVMNEMVQIGDEALLTSKLLEHKLKTDLAVEMEQQNTDSLDLL